MKSFRWLDFKITNRCNRKCVYCGVPHDSPSAPELLDSETVRRALEDAVDAGFTHVTLLGGEPSLREDIRTVFAAFSGTRILPSLMAITNGVVFNEELYRAVFGAQAETATVCVSFDSFREPNYKFQKPDRMLDHVSRVQGIAREYESGGRVRRVAIHSVISRENHLVFEKVVPHFAAMGIDVSFGLVCPARFLEVGTPRTYNEFTFEELEGIIVRLENLGRTGQLSFANRVLLDYLKLFPYGRLDQSSNCRAGRQVVIINPDGEVYPCITQSYASPHGAGNIRSEGFRDIAARLESFRCALKESPACWDHFLWDRLANRIEG